MRESVIASIIDDLAIIAVIAVAAAVIISLGLPWYIIIPVCGSIALISIAMVKGAVAQLRPPAKGVGSVEGLAGVVIDSRNGYLLINIEGELWRGRCVNSYDKVAPGVRVLVTKVNGLEVIVKPVDAALICERRD